MSALFIRERTNVHFSTSKQEAVFNNLIKELRRIGYTGDLLQRNYQFPNWFDPKVPAPLCSVPAAAFGQTPCSYSTACFALVVPNGNGSGADLVNQVRALGAPFAFEIFKDRAVQWIVGSEPAKTMPLNEIRAEQLGAFFQEKKDAWAGRNLIRAKNVGIARRPFQGDLFVDSGLVPALEAHIKPRLHSFLTGALDEAQAAYVSAEGHAPDDSQFFRLAFRLIAAKVLRDRGIGDFASLDPSHPEIILRNVESYYKDSSPALNNPQAQAIIADRLWHQVSFANLSVEVLAYIYEHTFVDNELRSDLGIHGTPHSIARYIVYGLPFEDIPESDRIVVEPCCGHGIFLVAALQRLRELLPPSLSIEERHEYFKQRLYGYDLDPFAIEVAKLSLMLSDFPSGDDWRVFEGDVFTSDKFVGALKRARIVLCNPPFKDFDVMDPVRSTGLSPRKPARLLQKVLDSAPANSLLGFVLPRVFLDGASYKAIRAKLAERYDEIEVLALPDKIFTSDIETALLLCKHPSTDHYITRVSFAHVPDAGREKFLLDYAVPQWAVADKTPREAAKSFKVVAFRDSWQRLRSNDKLHELASEIHRGIEWQPPFNPDRYISTVARAGFKPGVFNAKALKCFLPPPVTYLDARPESARGNALSHPWRKPKVLMNASRMSRGPWCISAFSDSSGLIAYQDFTAVWPHSGWSAEVVAAVLNGPIASAFVALREDKLHIRKITLKMVPMPRLSPKEREAIEIAVTQYTRALTKPRPAPRDALRALLKIDAAVLRGYGLPPPLEREILELFRWEDRPLPTEVKDVAGDYIQSLVRLRLEDELQLLERDEEDQRKTDRHLAEALKSSRLSFKRVAL